MACSRRARPDPSWQRDRSVWWVRVFAGRCSAEVACAESFAEELE